MIAAAAFEEFKAWFKSKNPIVQEITASVMGKFIAHGILKGTLQVADDGANWLVCLPKELVENQLKKRFP